MKYAVLLAAALLPAIGSAADFSGAWKLDKEFNGKPARVDYEVKRVADGMLSGSLLRNGSASPIRGARQP